MKHYSYFRSSAAYRVRIALNLKGVDYGQVSVDLVTAEQKAQPYLALNPQGLVPALELEDGTVLNQSMAILEWLEDTYKTPALYPAAATQRALMRGFCLNIACDVHPLNNLSVLNFLKDELDAQQEQLAAWYSHWVCRVFDAAEQQVATDSGKFCFGNTPSMADCVLIPQMYNALRFNVDVGSYPTLMSIYEHCTSLPAFASADPLKQSDNTDQAL
ncbi:MAG: maleylacetoacetate isomerase [Halioglobus sp.]